MLTALLFQIPANATMWLVRFVLTNMWREHVDALPSFE
jgi:hypothetical protein